MARVKEQIKPVVSILMPVYNSQDFIVESLSSILAQSYENFELIIIDDGSTDSSVAIALDFASNDPRIKVHSLPHVGLTGALNFGISICSGEYIARMDADDIALPSRLEVQLNQLKKANADLCGGAIETFGGLKSIRRYPETHEGCLAMSLFESPLAHPAVIGRSNLFRSLKYDVNMDKCEDYDLWVRAIKEGFKLTNVQAPVLMYRIHSNQVSQKYSNIQNSFSRKVRKSIWAYVFPEIPTVDQDQLVDEVFGGVEISSLTPEFVSYARSKSTLLHADATLHYYVFKAYVKSRSKFLAVFPKFIAITFQLNDSLYNKVFYSFVLFFAKLFFMHSDSQYYLVLKRFHLTLRHTLERFR